MLFGSKDIEMVSVPVDPALKVVSDNTNHSTIVFKNSDALRELIGWIHENRSVHYMSAGAFSSHELLFFLLDIIGPAKVYMTTWTMTEYPARLLSSALSNGKIKELFCILDVRMHKNEGVFQLIRNNSSKLRLAHCHAKVLVIVGDRLKVSVTSSQNMTENPRIECGVISCNTDVVEFHREWILNEIENGHELD